MSDTNPEPTSIRVALDWTPNTLHAGLYLALTQKLYSASNLTVHLLPPTPGYSTTPAKLLETGSADLAICPSESCIAYAESSKDSFHLQAIYAICQSDASAIVTTKASGLNKVSDLGRGGVKYGSYNARYEDDIVKAMVEADGGNGKGLEVQNQEGKLTLFQKVRKGGEGVDATWVFMPWEGVQAEMSGEELNVFKPEQYGVPYGYSPVIARNAASKTLSDDVLRRFVAATQKGYQMATTAGQTQNVVDALMPKCEPSQSAEFLKRSIESLSSYFGAKQDGLGHMEKEKWEKWVAWLQDKELIKDAKLKVNDLYSNEFLP